MFLVTSSFGKVLATLMLSVSLLFAPAVVFAEGGGGGEGGGGIGAAIGGFIDAVAGAVSAAASAVGAAIGAAVSAVTGFISTAVTSLTTAPAGWIGLVDISEVDEVDIPTGQVVGMLDDGRAVHDNNGNLEVGPTHDGGYGGEGLTCEQLGTCLSCPDGVSQPPCEAVTDCEWDPTPIKCYSPLNSCGGFDSGTREVCRAEDGAIVQQTACSVQVAPANPSYLGTSCEVARPECGGKYTSYGYGFKNCVNICSSVVYPTPLTPVQCATNECPAGYSGTYPNCEISTCLAGYHGTPPNCVPDVCPSGYHGTPPVCYRDSAGLDASISVIPTIVAPGKTTTVVWSSSDAVFCVVKADSNDDAWNTPSGTVTSSPIERKTTYSIECGNSTGEINTASSTVYVVPNWQEF